MSVLIIAEAGVNHNGDVAIARRLVDVAARAGADVVKFQTFKADSLVTRALQKAEYQQRATGTDESQWEMLRRLELSDEMHHAIVTSCAQSGIEFCSTGFDTPSIDYLLALGMSRVKIPSGEMTNLPFLRYVGACGLPIIMSTGMANLGEIEAALAVLDVAGTPRERVTVLQCTTEYPAPKNEVNLRAMQAIRDAFGVAVGLSDHTEGIEVAIAAVALGASVVEKHFTLDRALPGPDHRASIEPEELALLVRSIRNVEVALGDGVKRLSEAERKNVEVARRSIVAARPIKQDEIFGEGNLTTMRPGSGISPMHWDEVLGRRAGRDYAVGDMIEW